MAREVEKMVVSVSQAADVALSQQQEAVADQIQDELRWVL